MHNGQKTISQNQAQRDSESTLRITGGIMKNDKSVYF